MIECHSDRASSLSGKEDGSEVCGNDSLNLKNLGIFPQGTRLGGFCQKAEVVHEIEVESLKSRESLVLFGTFESCSLQTKAFLPAPLMLTR